MTSIMCIANMRDRELLDATVRAARDERRATADLLGLLAEVDARRLYLGEGCASLFAYCTNVLRLSEHAAYHRIEAARAARRFPVVLDLVRSGDITLTTVAMLRPHLTPENHAALLARARHKSKREVEYQIACLAPKPVATSMVRRVPETNAEPSVALLLEPLAQHAVETAALAVGAAPSVAALDVSPLPSVAASIAAAAPARVLPLASDRYLLRVTLGAGAHANLRRAQQLMRHSIPDGDAAAIVSRALSLLVEHLKKTTLAQVSRPRARAHVPRTRNRHIPAHVKREVWARDGGRCAFIGSLGRCLETSGLEFHHLVPFARHGATDVANISLRCRAHNQFESESVFGRWRRPDAAQVTRSGPS